MTARKAGRGSIQIGDESYATETFDFEGTAFTIRELSVDEGDDIWEAAQNPDKTTNNRLNTRLLLAKALVEPTVTIDQVGKWGGRKYTTVLRHFNLLNSIEDANPTPPAGSAGPTPPAGGEPSPTA